MVFINCLNVNLIAFIVIKLFLIYDKLLPNSTDLSLEGVHFSIMYLVKRLILCILELLDFYPR